MKKLSIFGPALILAGCANIYVEPSDGDIASLELPIIGQSTDSYIPTKMYFYVGELDEKGCIVQLDLVDSERDPFDNEVRIRANKDVMIKVHYFFEKKDSLDRYTCTIEGIANYSNQATYSIVYNFNDEGCSLYVVSGSQPINLVKPEPSGWGTCKPSTGRLGSGL